MVSASDGLWREIRIRELILDEGADAQDQCVLRDIGRQLGAPVESARECNGQQIQRGCPDADSADRIEVAEIPRKLACRRGEQSAWRIVGPERYGEQAHNVIGVEREQPPGESDGE